MAKAKAQTGKCSMCSKIKTLKVVRATGAGGVTYETRMCSTCAAAYPKS